MKELCIEGNPIPWKRAGRRRIGADIITYDRQLKEKEQIRWKMRDDFREEPFRVPLKVEIYFFMPIPKAASRKQREQMIRGQISHMKRPDIDNMAKFVLDCMTGVIFNDDAQINELDLKKRYATSPRTKIVITPKDSNIVADLPEDDEMKEDKRYEEKKAERQAKSRKSNGRVQVGNFTHWLKEGPSGEVTPTSSSDSFIRS